MRTGRLLSASNLLFVVSSAGLLACPIDSHSLPVFFSHTCSVTTISDKVVDSTNPKEILLQQPDFSGTEITIDFEVALGAGTNISTKLAKKGTCYRRETRWAVFYSKPNEPTLRFWKADNSYEYFPLATHANLWFSGTDDPAIFALKDQIKFEVAGSESIENHECTKIKGTPIGNAEENVVFYVARDLKNLVIKTVVTLQARVRTYLIREISFDVSDDLFQIPQEIRRPLPSDTGYTRPPATNASQFTLH